MSEETGPRSSRPTRLVVGLTGHPEAGLGVRLLELLRDAPIETHLVMCGCARDWVARTTGRTAEDVSRLADHVYDEANQAAKISSGSFLTAGMIVAPCSSRSLGSIAIGYASNLIHRAADVTLKEGRRLVLLVPASALGPGSAESVARLRAVPGAVVAPIEPSERPDRVLERALGLLELSPVSLPG